MFLFPFEIMTSQFVYVAHIEFSLTIKVARFARIRKSDFFAHNAMFSKSGIIIWLLLECLSVDPNGCVEWSKKPPFLHF